jgi:O-antigen/teichoic acid export membrane protein
MSKDIATSIARNATVMMGSQVVTWVSSFVLMMFLPRYLGSEDYGRLYLAMSIAMIAQVFVDFGGAYYIAKEIARHRDRAPSLIADSIGFRMGERALILLLALFSG